MTQVTPSIQRNFRRYQQKGWPGMLARPKEPHAFHPGIIYVPTGATRMPRPGDALYWDRTQNRYAIPTTAAELAEACAILSYDTGTVQQSLDAPPTGANSEHFIQYKNGDRIKAGVFGTFFVESGEACEYDDLMAWDIADYKWDVADQAAAAAIADIAALTGAVDLDKVNELTTAVNGLKDDLLTNVNTALTNLRRKPFVCVERAPAAASQIIEVQIGYGRVH